MRLGVRRWSGHHQSITSGCGLDCWRRGFIFLWKALSKSAKRRNSSKTEKDPHLSAFQATSSLDAIARPPAVAPSQVRQVSKLPELQKVKDCPQKFELSVIDLKGLAEDGHHWKAKTS